MKKSNPFVPGAQKQIIITR